MMDTSGAINCSSMTMYTPALYGGEFLLLMDSKNYADIVIDLVPNLTYAS